jgi:hypothetical protein
VSSGNRAGEGPSEQEATKESILLERVRLPIRVARVWKPLGGGMQLRTKALKRFWALEVPDSPARAASTRIEVMDLNIISSFRQT